MTGAVTIQQLIDSTRTFARLHWSGDEPFPEWRRWEAFLQGSVPYYQYGGCYALFTGGALQYIGVGASGGDSRYPARGLSRRMMSHVYQSDCAKGSDWSKLRPRWAGIDEIFTLGFRDMDYLAAALEAYLIRTLQPPQNSRLKIRETA